ncbi:MAG: sugar phosphate isomerase/epimerase, partial [Oscillospiraceae bacterium]|nr:sugar phosphate isomerase/epimerase [Oscillospiraceae bacterium]
VKDCFEYSVPTMVIHLPGDEFPITDLGMKRLSIIINEAEKYNIQIAFENLANINNLALVLEAFPSKNVGFCYDSCHHINFAPDADLLEQYGNRLMALHLQDNGGKHNQHQLPFDGKIDWTAVMKKISITGYKGASTLEPMNWDYEHLSIQQFLERAYQSAKRLDDMRTV